MLSPVIPSFLVGRETPQYDGGDALSNGGVREGEVVAVVYPDEKRSRSKKFIEYDVQVVHRKSGTAATRIYYNCQLINPLAGLADQAHWTLRPHDGRDTAESGLGKGSKVLLVCVSGETTRAVIIGGVRDQDDPGTAYVDGQASKLKDLKHHLYATFNGVSFYVDRDGQLAITYNGATDIRGKRLDSVKDDQVGSGLKFLKDGSVGIQDGSAKNAVLVDHQDHQVKVAHEKGFLVGAATDRLLLGESHRNAQKQMHQQIRAAAQSAQAALQAAAGALNVAGGSIAGPFLAAAAGPQLVAAAQAILQAAQQLNSIAQAVNAFEQSAQGKGDFLSKYNKAD